MELEQGKYYHIYNRGNNRENLFYEKRNYDYFLGKYIKHIVPIAETFAYCLLKNHFHFSVRIRENRLDKSNSASNKFKNFFISYAKAVNNAYGRTGALFQRPFGRREVTSDGYFARLVRYIHLNPQKHGFVKDFRTYAYSSYPLILSDQPCFVERDKVLERFGGKNAFIEFHTNMTDDQAIAGLIDEDE